jgi:hemolysin III
MDGLLHLHLHEPVSCLTHGLGAVLAVPATALLVHRVGRDTGRRAVAALYGATLVFCLLASAMFHGAVVDEPTRDRLCRVDHLGIFLLIAGTYTPLLTHLVAGAPWRRELAAVWLAAGTGGGVILVRGLLPSWMATSIYLVLGWSAVALYRHLRRTRPAGEVGLLLEGGLYYSIGAVVNLLRWPDPWPGVVGSHEVFHVLVLAGALAHYVLISRLLGAGTDQAPGELSRDRRADRGHRRPWRAGGRRKVAEPVNASRGSRGRGAGGAGPGPPA